jgi:hypothetical protein
MIHYARYLKYYKDKGKIKDYKLLKNIKIFLTGVLFCYVIWDKNVYQDETGMYDFGVVIHDFGS